MKRIPVRCTRRTTSVSEAEASSGMTRSCWEFFRMKFGFFLFATCCLPSSLFLSSQPQRAKQICSDLVFYVRFVVCCEIFFGNLWCADLLTIIEQNERNELNTAHTMFLMSSIYSTSTEDAAENAELSEVEIRRSVQTMGIIRSHASESFV